VLRASKRGTLIFYATLPLALSTTTPPGISFPLSLSPASSSAAVAESPGAARGGGDYEMGRAAVEVEAEGLARFRHILSSMRIKDWGLF
jgi:hypothetical protein